MSGSEIPDDAPPPLPPPKPVKCSEADALTNLEDHRCAICNKILINACRIDCGHTFCRYCLNVDRETRNERGKATCFVCDAAVTEISQNIERDKEIDKLYASLSIDEQLSRARTKAERKTEEERFANDKANRELLHRRDRENGDQEQFPNDRESFGRGDASASFNEDVGGASWREYRRNDHDVDGDENPAYYCTGACFWAENDEDPHLDDHEIFFLRCEDTDYEAARTDFNQPQSPQIVIHHTVQHVIHTVELREDRRDYSPMNDFRHRRDREPYENWDRGAEQFCGPPRYREHFPTSSTPPIPISNERHHRRSSQIPVYTQSEFYNIYGPPSASHQSLIRENCRGHQRQVPFCYTSANGYPHRQTSYTSDCSFEDGSPPYGNSGMLGEDNRSDDGNLCDFHRAMLEEEQRELEESIRTRNSRTSLHYDLNDEDTDGGDDSEYETENSFDHDLVTVNVTIPIPVAETHGRRRNPSERRSFPCPCPSSSSRHSLDG